MYDRMRSAAKHALSAAIVLWLLYMTCAVLLGGVVGTPSTPQSMAWAAAFFLLIAITTTPFLAAARRVRWGQSVWTTVLLTTLVALATILVLSLHSPPFWTWNDEQWFLAIFASMLFGGGFGLVFWASETIARRRGSRGQ